MTKRLSVLLSLFLSLPLSADWTLTVTATNGGVLCDNGTTATWNTITVADGAEVRLNPIPALGYCFDYWSGDTTGFQPRDLCAVVKMSSNKSITAHFKAWTPPIGCPATTGFVTTAYTKSYREYDEGGSFTRNPALDYRTNSEGGCYTHYVDNTAPGATDGENSYGRMPGDGGVPRLTIPATIPEGAIVEVHGGPYTYTRTTTYHAEGTAASPCFLRGLSWTDRPTLTSNVLTSPRWVQFSGGYLIVEYLYCNAAQLTLGINPAGGANVHDNMAFRFCECTATINGGAMLIHIVGGANGASNIVCYGNYLHDNGEWDTTTDQRDWNAISVVGGLISDSSVWTRNIWFTDNVIYRVEGDGFHVVWINSDLYDLKYMEGVDSVYYSRNICRWPGENSCDIKYGQNMIVSQNHFSGSYYHGGTCSAHGECITVNHEGPDSTAIGYWYVCNDISDCWMAVSGTNVPNWPYVIGNVIHDGTVFDNTSTRYGVVDGSRVAAVLFNTIHNWQGGIRDCRYELTPPANALVYGNTLSDLENYDFFISHDVSANLVDRVPVIISAHGTWVMNGGLPNTAPGFVDADNLNLGLGATSAALDRLTLPSEVNDIFDLFYNTYGVDLRKDILGTTRPQNGAWDYGAYEYVLVSITDLTISGTSQNSVTLGWTVPGEEGVTGTPASYDIRYADGLITEGNWETATQVSGEPVAGALGDAQTFTITGLDAGAVYYVAMKVLDEVGHSSELSNVVSATTATSGNHAPVLNVGDRSATELQELQFTVDADDADAGDTLTYSAPYLPAGAVFTPATRTFAWTPTFEQIGVHYATFEVTDGQVAVSETIAITVYSGSNHPPVLDAISDKSVDEGQTLSFSVSATDIDSGDTLSYSASGLLSGADFSDQTFTWTPTYEQAGSYDVTFTVSDGAATDSETITISVGNVNRAPVLNAVGNQSVNENFSLSFSTSATDPDGDSVSYSAAGLPSGATFANGVFSWTPGYDQAGAYPVTFTAGDGDLTASEAITITVVNVTDETPPSVHNLEPAADAIQVPLNTLIALTISDPGWGVDADTVVIHVNDELVYSGDAASYDSAYGACRRTGTAASYRYAYQPDALFDLDQQVTVRVGASDLAHNAMAEVSYEFATQMRSFGRNVRVSWGPDGFDKGSAATVCDSEGNIWVVWHVGAAGERDIYVSRKTQGYSEFADPLRLTVDAGDQSYPDIAVGTDDKLYVTWQDNRRGNWDVYVSTSADGATWSAETRVTDSEDNQVRPAIIVDSQLPDNRAYIAYQDDSAGHQDIYVASSTTFFVNSTETRVTPAVGDQIDPDIAVDAAGTVYLVWADGRGGTGYDVYGAASNDGSWGNVLVVAGAGSQPAPVIAAEASGSGLHFLWVDDTGTSSNIYYASSDAMPVASLTGTDIVNDAADQTAPAIITTGSVGGGLNVFACWQDARNVATSGDTDVYFVEVGAGSEESVFVGDDGSLSNQSEPALGVDSYGYPYIVWTDDRDGNTEIYYAGSTFMDPYVVDSQEVTASADHTIGIDPPTGLDDVSVVIPAGASPHDVTVTVTKIQNPPHFSSLNAIGYDFGPSGLQFSAPVTITIPYLVADFGDDPPAPCWYNYDLPLNPLSQEGITDVEILEITPGVVNAVQFKTTHFTPYYLADALPSSGAVGGGGGGGGCSLSSAGQGDPAGFLLPYLGLGIVMVLLRRRDRRVHQTRGSRTYG